MVPKLPKAGSAHVVVLGNEKGGSGKTTTAMHIVVALLKSGFRVASIDTDSRQRSFTRYIENRARWSERKGLKLELPTHHVVPLGDGATISEIEEQQFASYVEVIDRVETMFDFVIVDTPGSNAHLMRVSHAMADTLVTPVNDSFLDLDVLGRIDPQTMSFIAPSHYTELVRAAMAERRLIDGQVPDWVVVRNRLPTLASRNLRNVLNALSSLSAGLGFRVAHGISERVIFRELFPFGLTAFDPLDRGILGVEPTMSHVAARREIRELIDCLRLPMPGSRAFRSVPTLPLVPAEATEPAIAAA